ncbi:hypothetical protein T265_12403 [Opisthorchis viverrini]|uniref:Uncharacterized protein n=1 Tax=Opisthorchis viverrini TaxID=6198 RepID=A0A074ZRQ5_OPIVI|nr:hypothetical protein T265_12403 [Opisthorchis viverrini]KER17999.1 hypothetical protein T265_12403 [Opisthorchis viverrini]
MISQPRDSADFRSECAPRRMNLSFLAGGHRILWPSPPFRGVPIVRWGHHGHHYPVHLARRQPVVSRPNGTKVLLPRNLHA